MLYSLFWIKSMCLCLQSENCHWLVEMVANTKNLLKQIKSNFQLWLSQLDICQVVTPCLQENCSCEANNCSGVPTLLSAESSFAAPCDAHITQNCQNRLIVDYVSSRHIYKGKSSKINFYFYFATFPRIASMMYLVNIVTHMQMNWNFQQSKDSFVPIQKVL